MGDAPSVKSQGVTQEIWEQVRGKKVDDLRKNGAFKKDRPTRAYVIETFDSGDLGDDYGARYSALLSVPACGIYNFWLAADDEAELWLSTDENPANLRKIGELSSYTGRKSFGKRGKSECITLEKGKKYYIQALHKEAASSDHLAVAWSRPGQERELIAVEYLSPVLDGRKNQALTQTVKTDEHRAELLDTLRKQTVADVSGWLDKLPEKDGKLLAAALVREEQALSKLPEPEKKEVLKAYAEIARGITADKNHSVKNPAARRMLYLEEAYLKCLDQQELKAYGAHRLAYALGTVPGEVKTASETVLLDSRGDKWTREMVSTGQYALPGVPVTITIPDSLKDSKLSLQIGHHIEPNDRSELVSMPGTTRLFPLTEAKTTVVSPHGGIMLLHVPKEVELKQTPVVIEGAIRTPRFILGKTSDDEWKAIRQQPAPWGELISEHLLLLVNSDDLKKLDNPTELMTWWNENCRVHQDFYSYYPGIPFRMHNALYARQGVSYWPLEWKSENMPRLLDIKQMKDRNDALFLHEHGHHADFGDMEVGYWSESTCNWAGYYMKSRIPFNWKDSPDTHMRKLFDSGDKAHNEIKQEGWYSISTKGTHHWSYPVTSMMLGYTEDFGWEPLKETIRRLRDKNDSMYKWDFVQGTGKDRAKQDQAKIDRYLIGLSEEGKRDVRPYFEHFKMRPSPGAADYLNKLNLPRWDLSYLPLPEVATTTAGQSLTIPNPQKSVLSMAGETKIVWKNKTPHGQTVVSDNGDLVYTPDAEFTGEDKLPYVLSNSVGDSPVKYLPVMVKKAE